MICSHSVSRLFQSLERLVLALDRCASRTGSLPIETVSLLPSHCSRFSLSCLQKLFSLARYEFVTLSFVTTIFFMGRSFVTTISLMLSVKLIGNITCT